MASHQDYSWGFPGALNEDGIKEKLTVLSAQGCQDKRPQTRTLQYRVFPYNLKAKVRDQRMVTFLCAMRKERFLFESCEISSSLRALCKRHHFPEDSSSSSILCTETRGGGMPHSSAHNPDLCGASLGGKEPASR